MGIKLVSSSGGSVELNAPVTASNFTHTVPAQTGTVLLKESTSGMSVPAFSAYASAGTSCNNGAATKIAINTEEFDTASCFDNATNFRLTPNVPGYYKVTGYVSCGSTTGCYVAIFKNGSEFKRGSQSETSAPMVGYVVDSLIYFNGSTDYAELYFYNGSGSAKTTNGGASLTYFQGVLVRAA